MKDGEHDALGGLLEPLPDEALVPVGWLRSYLRAPAPTEPIGDLSCAQAAEALGRKPGTVRGWCARGEIPGAYRLNGREWRVPRAGLRAYLDGAASREREPVDPGSVDLGSWRRKVKP